MAEDRETKSRRCAQCGVLCLRPWYSIEEVDGEDIEVPYCDACVEAGARERDTTDEQPDDEQPDDEPA